MQIRAGCERLSADADRSEIGVPPSHVPTDFAAWLEACLRADGTPSILATALRPPAACRSRGVAIRETLSPVERLEMPLHPRVSFVRVALFALAHVGLPPSVADTGSRLVPARRGSVGAGKAPRGSGRLQSCRFGRNQHGSR